MKVVIPPRGFEPLSPP